MRPTAYLSMAGQSIWLDNITRTMLDDGTLAGYIRERSVVGLTSNPTIFEKAVKGGHAYDEQIRLLHAKGIGAEACFFELALADLRRAADLFAPVHARTGGIDGWVSLEVSPTLADDTTGSVTAARALAARAERRNLFIKVPGTKAGIPAIEELIAAGIPVNVTLLFSADHYKAAAEAYLRGIERRVKQGLPPTVGSVASLFVSRWDKKTSGKLPRELKDTVGIAMARRCWRAYCDLYSSDRWLALEAAGARPQRLLYASTSTKDPALPDTLYVQSLASPRTVNTMPEETLHAFFDHGKVPQVLSPMDDSHEAILGAVSRAGVDLAACAQELQSEGCESFCASWRDLLATIDSRCASLVA